MLTFFLKTRIGGKNECTNNQPAAADRDCHNPIFQSKPKKQERSCYDKVLQDAEKIKYPQTCKSQEASRIS